MLLELFNSFLPIHSFLPLTSGLYIQVSISISEPSPTFYWKWKTLSSSSNFWHPITDSPFFSAALGLGCCTGFLSFLSRAGPAAHYRAQVSRCHCFFWARAIACSGFRSCSVWAQQSDTGLAAPWHMDLPQTGEPAHVPCIGWQILSTLTPGSPDSISDSPFPRQLLSKITTKVGSQIEIESNGKCGWEIWRLKEGMTAVFKVMRFWKQQACVKFSGLLNKLCLIELEVVHFRSE